MHNDTILKLMHLPPEIKDSPQEQESFIEIPDGIYDIESVVEDVTVHLIKKALEQAKGNTTKAASLLGIPRGTLRYKISKLKID